MKKIKKPMEVSEVPAGQLHLHLKEWDHFAVKTDSMSSPWRHAIALGPNNGVVLDLTTQRRRFMADFCKGVMLRAGIVRYTGEVKRIDIDEAERQLNELPAPPEPDPVVVPVIVPEPEPMPTAAKTAKKSTTPRKPRQPRKPKATAIMQTAGL
jgi:hypothetical protein